MSVVNTGKVDAEYRLPIQINYEDTDAGGVVYHGNYLAYMERARSACLRESGFPMKVLQSEYNLLLVVVEANLRYFKSAKLDDLIEVTVHIEEIKGATFRVLQRVYRDVDLLTEGVIHLGALHTDTVLPCRIPTDLRQSICRCQLQSF